MYIGNCVRNRTTLLGNLLVYYVHIASTYPPGPVLLLSWLSGSPCGCGWYGTRGSGSTCSKHSTYVALALMDHFGLRHSYPGTTLYLTVDTP